MPLNLDRRIELLFPVEEKRHVKRLMETLTLLLSDNRKARIMKSDGSYVKVGVRGKETINSQVHLQEKSANR